MATPFCHSSLTFLNYCYCSTAGTYARAALKLQHDIGLSNSQTMLDLLKWVVGLRQSHLGSETKSLFHPSVVIIGLSFIL